MRRLRWRGALLACVALAMRAPAFQAPSTDSSSPDDHAPHLIPRTRQEREQRFIAQHRIILNMRVADANGRPLNALSQADFTLLDNNQPRKLVDFRAVDGSAAGAHVMVVLDAVNLFSRQLRSFEKDIEKYLKQGVDPLPVPVSIGVFSGLSIELGPPSRDRKTLLAELTSRTSDLHAAGCITQLDHGSGSFNPYTSGAMGNIRAQSPQELACKNERFVKSVNALSQLVRKEMDTPGRAIMIWLGPGWPLLTDRGFTPDTPEMKRSFFDQLVSLSMNLREAQTTINAVASPDEAINPETPNLRDSTFFEGIRSEDQVSAANLGLHVLAHQTGGEIVAETKDVAGQISACIEDAKAYYVLAFDSPPAASFGEYHALTVKVDKPGLEVRMNTLYYAEQ